MRKLLLFAMLLLPSLAYAQGGSLFSGGITVLSASGRPIGGATVTICAFGASGIPCSPTITVYTSPTLSVTAANPGVTDGNGNLFVYASPGRYTYTVTGTGITGTSFTATVAGSGGGDVISSGNNTFTGNNTHSGTETFKQLNNVIAVDGTSITTIQACVNAAAALSTPGKCFVPTGAATNTTQVEMASGVTLEFAPGTFLNTCSGGNIIFVHFAVAVSNAAVVGQARGSTILKNNTGGTQCGAVVQDEGTDNSVGFMTLDGNANTTSTGIWLKATRPKVYALRLLHNTGIVAGQNYAVDIRGGSQFEFSDIETVGGNQGGFSMVTKDGNGDYGSIVGGRFVNVYAHDSRRSGFDFRASGTNETISGVSVVNAQSYNNGTSSGAADDILDDQFGFSLVATLAADGSAFTNNNVYNLIATGNKGSGIRFKGAVNFSTVTAVNVYANGSGTAVDKDGIRLLTSQGTSAPAGNWITGATRKGSATNALSTDANTTTNVFTVTTFNGATFDPVSLGNFNDAFQGNFNLGGQLAYGPVLYLGQTALTSDPTNLPAIYNRSGVGLNIRSGGQINAILSAGQSFNIQSAPGSNVATFLANGGFDLLETAAPSGSSALDFFWGDSTTHTPSWNNNNNGTSSPTGAWQCTNVTPVTVNANVATDQNMMACTIPAGTLNRVGRTLRINVAGIFSTPAATTETLTLKTKLCTVSGCGSGTVITPISLTTISAALTATNFGVNLEGLSTTQTAGVSSAYEANGNLFIDLLAATADSVYTTANTATVGTIDSTGQLFLQVTVAFSSASASNSFTERKLVLETIN